MKTFFPEHRGLLHQVLMNIACTKETIAIFHAVNKIKQSTFYYKATLKVLNSVFSIYLLHQIHLGFG